MGEKGSAHAASGLLIPAALNEVVSLPVEDRSLALQIQQLIPTPPLRNTSIWRSIFAGSHLSSESKNASTSRGLGGPAIPSCRWSGVRLTNHANPLAVIPKHFACSIGRSVIDNDHLEVPVSLFLSTVDGTPQHALPIVSRDDCRNSI